MQKKKLNDQRFDVYYNSKRTISFPNDCHLGSQSTLTWPMMKSEIKYERNSNLVLNRAMFTSSETLSVSLRPICTRKYSKVRKIKAIVSENKPTD